MNEIKTMNSFREPARLSVLRKEHDQIYLVARNTMVKMANEFLLTYKEVSINDVRVMIDQMLIKLPFLELSEFQFKEVESAIRFAVDELEAIPEDIPTQLADFVTIVADSLIRPSTYDWLDEPSNCKFRYKIEKQQIGLCASEEYLDEIKSQYIKLDVEDKPKGLDLVPSKFYDMPKARLILEVYKEQLQLYRVSIFDLLLLQDDDSIRKVMLNEKAKLLKQLSSIDKCLID